MFLYSIENNYIFLYSIEKKETKLTFEEERTGKATERMQCFKFNSKGTLEHAGIQTWYNSVTIILKFLKSPSFSRINLAAFCTCHEISEHDCFKN